MRRLLVFFTAFLAFDALAVAPQFWRVQNPDEFLAGEIDGFAVTSRGELRPAPAVRRLATFNDPFVLSQVTGANHDQYFGTGNEGKIYRLRGGETKLIYTAAEPEIYALAWRDGALYVASSPNGKIYKVDPDNGKGDVFYDPKQAYIWSLLFLPNGDLAVGTGVDGKLFRVTTKGEGKVWFDSPETHIRSLALRPNGTLLAGASGQGRIYAVNADGTAHALYDSALNEISAIYVDSNGVGWAAGVSNVLPSSAPKTPQPKPQPQQQQQQGSRSQQQANEPKKEEATATAEVSFSFDEGSGGAQSGTGELYRINTDDFVEIVRKFDREMIYAINAGREGGVLLSTGPQGRIYEYRNGETALVANVPEKQVVSIASGNPSTIITTTNSGAVYRLEPALSNRAEFRSAAKDVERFSRFGNYRVEGSGVKNGTVAIAFRSGNTRTPDATWSAWTAPSTDTAGNIAAPPGRYLQWKLTMPKPSNDVTIDGVTIAFMNRNVAPVIDSVSVQDPAVVFITSSYPASPQVVEATNPDEYGIFTSLDNPRDKSEQQGKKVFRKGYRTILWRARDDNNDELRYSVFFRQKGSTRWLRLRENIEETSLNFDTSQIPDGTYELRVTVTDAVDNPEMPLNDAKEGVEFVVDNTSPQVSSSAQGEEITVRIADTLSPIGKVEYSADAQKWIRLTPEDGIADSLVETYRLPKNTIGGKFVVIRATDAFYNVVTTSVAAP